MRLLERVAIGPRQAANRLLFGPIVTNLGTDERTLSDRHRAFYARRAAGGCGTIVIEEASVHESDWPYERSPLAARCVDGWAAIATATHEHGALALAGLGHAGSQGSSAYSQRELWAPSRVPDVASREVPKWMESEDIAAVIGGFEAAARLATEAGLDGVEVNAGQFSLIRQFLSGLTNQRGDEWGTDRLRFLREVLAATRRGVGADRIVSLRLSADELAPWAGITAESGAEIAAAVAGQIDLLVVTKGSIFSAHATRPDFHEPAGGNIELCRLVRAAVNGAVPVVLQGSVVDPGQADWAIGDGACDLVEMTRAQLADPDLAVKVAAGRAPRPCVLCNQTCQVRDARNPIITCIGEPATGHELDEPAPTTRRTSHPRRFAVIGAGPAGLEFARLAAAAGHEVTVYERAATTGGPAALVGPIGPLAAWLTDEATAAGATIKLTVTITADNLPDADTVVLCNGSRPNPGGYEVAGPTIMTPPAFPPESGVVAIWDPIGGPIAVALAERLGDRAVLITPDQIAGNELSRTGDLAPCNTRLAQRGVRIERRSIVRRVEPGAVTVEDRFSGRLRRIDAEHFVDAGFRVPRDDLWEPTGRRLPRAGDAVAPRTVAEAVLEGRRLAIQLGR